MTTRTCPECGKDATGIEAQWLDGQQARWHPRCFRKAQARLAAKAIPIDPRKLAALLERAGLSQRRAAKELQIHERTMRGYVLGEKPTPKTVELALLYLAEHPTK
jgi:hypothetical protein